MGSIKMGEPGGTYVSHSTVLLILGKCTFEEYMTNRFKENISSEMMNKKYYIDDKLAILDSKYEKLLDRLKLVKTLNKEDVRIEKEEALQTQEANSIPSVTTRNSKRPSAQNQKKLGSTPSGRKTPSPKEVVSSSSSGTTQRPLTPGPGLMTRLRSSPSPNRTSTKGTAPSATSTNPVKRPLTPFVEPQKVRKIHDSQLPDELLMCGECSMTMSSIQHLDRHLERCRGNKRRSSTETVEVPSTKRVSSK